jgi:hypothetical protein
MLKGMRMMAGLNGGVVFHQDAELDGWLVKGVTLSDQSHVFGELFSNRLAHGQIVTTHHGVA